MIDQFWCSTFFSAYNDSVFELFFNSISVNIRLLILKFQRTFLMKYNFAEFYNMELKFK